ncbi:hypothetical protein BDW22DRAFT_1325752 [Trametopsis cervina]|nr:hypothetical protein BDW22DRAFT_1325752 [Trametopsis cervina]
MATALSNSTIHETNPYEGHPSLTELEAEVLWQYARLAQNVKEIAAETRRLSKASDETLLERLRSLQGKMDLVMTFYKASVFSMIMEQPASDAASLYPDETAADETVMQ